MRILHSTIALLALIGCQHATVKQTAKSSDSYLCRFASSPITIDGKLDEPAWRSAMVVKKFYPYPPDAKGDLPPTTARLLWDHDYLYVAYDNVDTDLHSFSTEHDAILSGGDQTELMLRPDLTKPVFIEFLVAPNGTFFDCRYPCRGENFYLKYRNWESGAKVAAVAHGTDNDTSDTDRGYTVEMAIPLTAFADLSQPRNGVRWTFGVFRYDFDKSRSGPQLMMSIPKSLHDGFHYYEGFNTLDFVQ